jgi:hypothetical protein
MIASGAVPALLPAHIGVSHASQFTTRSGLCRHPASMGPADPPGGGKQSAGGFHSPPRGEGNRTSVPLAAFDDVR